MRPQAVKHVHNIYKKCGKQSGRNLDRWKFDEWMPWRIPQYHDSIPSLDGRITIMYLSKSEIEDAYVFLFIRYNSYQIIYMHFFYKFILTQIFVYVKLFLQYIIIVRVLIWYYEYKMYDIMHITWLSCICIQIYAIWYLNYWFLTMRNIIY